MKKLKLINNEKLDLIIKPLQANSARIGTCSNTDDDECYYEDGANCPIYSLDICGIDNAACTLHSQDTCDSDFAGCTMSHTDICTNSDTTTCHEAFKYDITD